MSGFATAAVLLMALTLVDVSHQRPRNYGKLKVCPPGQKCGVYAVESESVDGKMYYVLKYYPEEAADGGASPGAITGGKPAEGSGHKPFVPTYIIGGPTGKCPEGKIPDHSGYCRDPEF